MKKLVVAVLMLFTGFGVLSAQADDSAVKAQLNKMGIKNAEITASPINGLKAVFTEQGVLYISADGKNLLQGPLYQITATGMVNNTNVQLLGRLEAMKDQMIVYKAKNEKHVITVFTDITCGYCHKLHDEMKAYNDAGITVRYLAFPRNGLESETSKTMQSVWCMADRKKAFDKAMKGDKISPATCKTDINKQFTLGVQFGVTGTPAIVLSNGMMLPGYRDAKGLEQMLSRMP